MLNLKVYFFGIWFAVIKAWLQAFTHLDLRKGFRIYVFHKIILISTSGNQRKKRKKIVTVLAYGSKFINKKFENIHHIFNS